MKKISGQSLKQLEETINAAVLDPHLFQDKSTLQAVELCLEALTKGDLRIVSPAGYGPDCGAQPMCDLASWHVHVWLKQAVLLALRLRPARTFAWPVSSPVSSTYSLGYHDKLGVQGCLAASGVRSLYGSIVREGAHVSPRTILMPSFVNVGAWIGEGTLIDTWATAGSCAQIGKNVHIAGGVGIGGVLEPASARPVLVGDDAFLGSRVVVVEGTIVSERAILGANVCLTASTPIYDVTNAEKKEYRGFVPAGAVVIAGTRTKSFPGGEVPLQCAYIIAYRSEKTDSKVSLNEALRETGLAI